MSKTIWWFLFWVTSNGCDLHHILSKYIQMIRILFNWGPTHMFILYGISPCRSKIHPWGLPDFLKHPAIILSNKIIQNTLKLVIWLAKHGVRVSIENPRSSTLWSLPEIHEMVLQEGHLKKWWDIKKVFTGFWNCAWIFGSPPLTRRRPTGTTPTATIAALACSTARELVSFHASFTNSLCKRGHVSWPQLESCVRVVMSTKL